MRQGTRQKRQAYGEVGLDLAFDGDELHGTIEVLPTMWTPGSRRPMMSVAATWVDTQLGILAIRAFEPRLVLTLELGIHLFDEITDVSTLRTIARVVRTGSSVAVLRMDITTDDGRPAGLGHGTFIASPDPTRTMPTATQALAGYQSGLGPLDEPFAVRVGCQRTAPGEAVMPYAPHVSNGTKAIQGGLLTAVIEEAARSADPEQRPLGFLHVRYLRSVRVGPAVARASLHQGVGEVEVVDSGTGSLALLATTRVAG